MFQVFNKSTSTQSFLLISATKIIYDAFNFFHKYRERLNYNEKQQVKLNTSSLVTGQDAKLL